MSWLQEWLLRRIVRSTLSAMPYTVRLFAVIRQEAMDYYQDNAYGIDSYLQEAMSYSAPPKAERTEPDREDDGENAWFHDLDMGAR